MWLAAHRAGKGVPNMKYPSPVAWMTSWSGRASFTPKEAPLPQPPELLPLRKYVPGWVRPA